jgi:hypothetical protein
MLERIRGIGQLIGLGFAGDRDYYSVFGWKRTLTYLDYLGKYRRQDIATRLVDAEPHATWSNPPEVSEDSDQAFKEVWDDLVSDFSLFEVFSRLDKLVGLGHYAVMIVGFDDGSPLESPISSNKKNVIYLQPYSEDVARIDTFQEDPADPRFGLPETYEVEPGRADAPTSGVRAIITKPKSFKVHHSRVLHVAEGGLEDLIFGTPRMEKVYNLLDDLLKTQGGSSETFWLTSNRGIQVDVDKEMDLKQADADALDTEIDEYYHNLRRVIRSRGVTINDLGSDVADPRGNFDILIGLISAATSIPKRILMGTEAGQLSSEQDRANWAVHIEGRRSLFAEPIILNPFVKMLVASGVAPSPNNLAWLWPEAFRMSPLERAQAGAQKARTLANVSKALEATIPPITLEEGRKLIGLEDPTPIFDDAVDATQQTPPQGTEDSGGQQEPSE